MNQSNKILTVSYGTFSCTLEGFEDSFDTMKAIAEYFRDLAADDRYFGAEPPTPDAEMLARIAEKEIARRVEAHQDTAGIHLRAAGATPAALAQPDPTPEVQTPVAEAPAPQTDPAPEQVEDAASSPEEREDTTDIAPEVDLAAIGAAVSSDPDSDTDRDTGRDADLDDATEVASDDFEDVDHADAEDMASVDADEDEEDDDLSLDADFDDTDFDTGIDAVTDSDSADVLENDGASDTDLSEVAASEPVARRETQPAARDPQPEPETDTSSVAAKLARIRQVVSNKPAPNTDGFAEDQDMLADAEAANAQSVDDAAQEIERDQSAAFADLDDATDLDDVDLRETAKSAPQDTIANVLDQMRDAPADPSPEAEPTEALAEEGAPQPAPRAPISARVIKVKRKALDAAVSQGMLEEIADEDEDQPEVAPPAAPEPAAPKAHATGVPSSLSDDDEADLQAALAEVAAELDEDDAPKAAPAPQFDATTVEEPADLEPNQAMADLVRDTASEDMRARRSQRSALLRDGVSEESPEVDRLLDKADSEMAEPTGQQRRNAISHLRAAVAATRDDDALGSANDTEKGSQAYRDDLEEVVRPRRPVASGTARDARPEDSKPAPLQLVAEQRVDEREAAPAAPVRPRRVSAVAMADEADAPMELDEDVSFAEFAEEMGATELPDLLEAAAAYMSFVEKRPAFSRQQLMTKVRSVEALDYTREDRLRSFGVLLREAKIEKTQGGQFTASDRISYRPDEDRVAG